MREKRYSLLTGGTGLVGQSVLLDLMRCGLPVAVLARATRDQNAAARIELQMRAAEKQFNRTFPRPVVIPGELTHSELGMSEADQLWVRRHCQNVIHSGASLSFRPAHVHPQNEPFTTNVDGTRSLAEFCLNHGIQEFHHISSAYICGRRTGRVFEDETNVGQDFSNDYEKSKCQAEDLLKEAFRHQSLTIYRPSIVIDPRPGAMQLGDRTIYLAFSLLQLMAKKSGLPDISKVVEGLGLTGTEHKNIVPVEWISRIIVQIVRRPNLHQSTYHLTHPVGTTFRELMTGFYEALKSQGFRKSVVEADVGDTAGLNLLISQFVGTFQPYFRDDPVFDQTNLLKALDVCGDENCPDMSRVSVCSLGQRQIHVDQSASPEFKHAVNSAGIWRGLAGENSSFSEIDRCDTEAEWGLVLSGENGGDWVISSRTDGFVRAEGGAESASMRIYCSAQTWEQVLRKQVSLIDVYEDGQIHLECCQSNIEESELKSRFMKLAEQIMQEAHFDCDGRDVSLDVR
ncbi:SDR family oxidoreductase [Planctomicrobium sp. SH668]|uniref:SDR family oxidoreductase n=1 Tax=Planctomicrobium sp. SH668 TaxID=3448126 RepID=UPI003F5C9F2D